MRRVCTTSYERSPGGCGEDLQKFQAALFLSKLFAWSLGETETSCTSSGIASDTCSRFATTPIAAASSRCSWRGCSSRLKWHFLCLRRWALVSFKISSSASFEVKLDTQSTFFTLLSAFSIHIALPYLLQRSFADLIACSFRTNVLRGALFAFLLTAFSNLVVHENEIFIQYFLFSALLSDVIFRSRSVIFIALLLENQFQSDKILFSWFWWGCLNSTWKAVG